MCIVHQEDICLQAVCWKNSAKEWVQTPDLVAFRLQPGHGAFQGLLGKGGTNFM